MIDARDRATGIHWNAALQASLIAGVLFLLLQMVMGPLFVGGAVWDMPRLTAAIVLGRDVAPPPGTFSFGVVATGIAIHAMLSAVYGIIIAAIVHRMVMPSAVMAGAVFGLALYTVNFYAFTAMFDWFAMARTWVTVLTHLLFGVSAAWVYRTHAA